MAETHFDEWIAEHFRTLWPELHEPALIERTVAVLAELANGGAALEFGVGTGRVALPLSQRGLDVNLPPPSPPGTVPPPSQIVLEYTSDKRLSINSQAVAPANLGERLRLLYESRNDKTLFVMGAGSLRYGDVIPLIDAARGAGVTRVGIITERARLAH